MMMHGRQSPVAGKDAVAAEQDAREVSVRRAGRQKREGGCAAWC